jgi:hypothetical protein
MDEDKRDGVDVKEELTTHRETEPERDSWNVADLGEQSSYEGTTEMKRRLRRADETKGDPDARDVAGSIPKKDTPHGRERRHTPNQTKEDEASEVRRFEDGK